MEWRDTNRFLLATLLFSISAAPNFHPRVAPQIYHQLVNTTSRRQFLTLLGAPGLSAAIPSSAFAALAPPLEPFTFLFITDTHLQPELNGVIGTDMAFKKARAIKADFAINGGDHVFDALAVPIQRPPTLFHLYDNTEQDLGLNLHP